MALFGWCIDELHSQCHRTAASIAGLECSCYCHHRHTATPAPATAMPVQRPTAVEAATPPVEAATPPVEAATPPVAVVYTSQGPVELPDGITLDAEGTLRVHDPDGQLHNPNGPAVSYADGSTEFWWHGTRVTREQHQNKTGAQP